ncbi:MAG: hypothetical protein ACRDJN_30455, partial [Chloroflexota bacterium]
WQARSAGPQVAATAVCLALMGGLLLAGTTPRQHLPLAMLALLPLASPWTWQRLPDRGRIAGLAAAGYLLAGTSAPMLGTAAAQFISRWPPLASLPALGLALLTAVLAMMVRNLTPPRGRPSGLRPFTRLPYKGRGTLGQQRG